MANLFRSILGGASSAASAVASDADFADFATAAAPSAPVHAASSVFTEAAATATQSAVNSLLGASQFNTAGRPYTAWYRVWERVTLADFYQEFMIIPFIVLIILVHLWGVQANRSRAKKWAATHIPLLEEEFAVVGLGQGSDTGSNREPIDALKAEGSNVFTTYCTGRQNVACVDIRLNLYKRYNPISWFAEEAMAFLMESVQATVERMEATAYSFDGKEKALAVDGNTVTGLKDSSYDGFVFAIVNKELMNKLRNDRYDLSLTTTKDHPKLPDWATVMSESAEVTETLLTADLAKAVSDAGPDFEALIISDQAIDAPKKLDDIVPKKRITLSLRLGSKGNTTPIFTTFLRLTDQLVSVAHFRPEALRRIKATREEESRKIRKQAEDEKSEERRLQSEKLKKQERDQKLSRLSADEQKKFLQKERDAEQRKSMKKRTTRA